MQRIFKLFLDICLLRAGPQDVPAAPSLFLLTLLAYLGVGLATAWPGNGPLRAFAATVLDALVLAGVLRLALRLYGKPARFQQTFTAMLGCGTLFGVIGWPLLMALGPQLASGSGVQMGLPVLALFVLMLWNITVNGHILRHAFERGMALGVLWSLLYLYVSWNVSAVALKLFA
jgi:hypothetical protein